ncbi:ABC transporter substrate-binding protein [Microlunatus speluncae]|uniref:ABC transporter substrate-binding protein n=1 Tax=Microlunatus speluncae TaxID=2594267 RepID=UPI001C2CD9AF|nr:ABC transporter substrate-binding protein [Microlunatus speluncae]
MRTHRIRGRLLALLITGLITALVGVAGCAAPAPPTTAPASPGVGADGCVESFDPAADYFPDKQQLEFAKNLKIDYHGSYQVITVQQPVIGGKPESYVFLRCGAPKPELTGAIADAPVITTPVRSLFSGSTTHLPSLEALGRLDVLTGVAAKAYISSAAAKERADSGEVIEYAAAGTPDAEAIVAGKPDVVITDGLDSPAFATVRDAGIGVLAGAEFLENDPLGRAEWIKFFAALTGTEAKAAEVFGQIRDDYRKTSQLVADAEPVDLLLSQPYQGVWSIPGGGSFAGKLIKDAGGRWPWQDDPTTGSINTDLEAVLGKSAKAPIWINTANWRTLKEATTDEPRLAEFAAYKSGQVWSPSKQLNEAGGNNYFELGVLRPDLTLADLVAITHPDLLPDHPFTFYQRLP